MLGQETAGLFAVTGSCFGFRPVILVYIKGNTFMNSSILLRQIVVILIIRIEIFQLTTVDFDKIDQIHRRYVLAPDTGSLM